MKPKIFLVLSILVLLSISLACQVGGPFSAIFATETPTPTITPSPTPTFTPTPTITPSPTPLPTGVQAETLDDESIVFTDYDNKFRLSLPKGWLVIPLSVDDISKAFDKISETNPQLADAAEAFKSLDPDVVRVVALNDDPEYFQNGFATNVTITAIEDKVMSAMPMAFVTGALESSFEQAGAKVLTSDANIVESKTGVEIGVIEVEQSIVTGTGSKVTVYSKYLLFQVEGKVVMVQLATLSLFADDLNQVMDAVAESIERLKP